MRPVAFFGIEIKLVAVNSQHGWHGGANLLKSIFNCRAWLFGRRAWPQPFHPTRRTGENDFTPARKLGAVQVARLVAVSLQGLGPAAANVGHAAARQRVPNQKGDLPVIRVNSSIKRSDFGIMPGQMEEKVSDTIELTLSIAGASPR